MKNNSPDEKPISVIGVISHRTSGLIYKAFKLKSPKHITDELWDLLKEEAEDRKKS